MSNKKISTQNLLTGIVVGLAVILVVVVILVKTGVIGGPQQPTEAETEEVSSVVVVSETQEDGSVVYYTMVTKYFKPKVSSNHTYPSTKPKTTTTTVPLIEFSTMVQVTDADGNAVYDENGVPVTELVTYSVPADSTTTQAPTTEFIPQTSYVQVTDKLHRPVKDENGNPVTEVVTLDAAPTTKPPIWTEAPTEETTTSKINIDLSGGINRDDVLAQNIVTQLNEDRAQLGLAPLSFDTNLNISARSNSLGMAKPDTYGQPDAAGANTFTTAYGGNQLYQEIKSSLNSKAMSINTTKIGVGVVKYQDMYYTTVIFE